MSSIDGRYLCVSIHDVAPQTWSQCQRLIHAVKQVDDIPLTLLVVPRFHGLAACPPWYERQLGEMLVSGDELALHGYTHSDDALPASGWRAMFLRTVYTEREGEFAALGMAQARMRLEQGVSWFAQRGWPVRGFVAPAWLLSDGAWAAVRQAHLDYTTTMLYFHQLAQGGESTRIWSPSLFYTSRNEIGRRLSPIAASSLASLLKRSPLVRLGLHPRDADHPALLKYTRSLLAQLLQTRFPLTKAGFADVWSKQQRASEPGLASEGETGA